mmetsp:Transcript_44398/g.105169  ORF Transcript_44398/g.105169 Transcript_44398/m.105169 type:complete len:248 (+) Transcript_44398:57-800(+)
MARAPARGLRCGFGLLLYFGIAAECFSMLLCLRPHAFASLRAAATAGLLQRHSLQSGYRWDEGRSASVALRATKVKRPQGFSQKKQPQAAQNMASLSKAERRALEQERQAARAAIKEKQAFKRKYGKGIDCYRSPSGHEVVVGRQNDKNEYISLKLAKGDTVWFHVEGCPGSHVLINAPESEVDRDDMEFAAKIAAYHSKARDQKMAAVLFCNGGQVGKVPGTPTGTVTTSGRKRTMRVTPELPEEE